MRRATICVGVGTPEQAAISAWLRRWGPLLRSKNPSNEGCGCCVDIYFVEALPEALAELPASVIVSDTRPKLADLVRAYCKCVVPPLSDAERMLLENTLDAHDRLWDGESSVVDVWALYTATAEALRSTPHFKALEPAVAELAGLMRSDLPATEKRERACWCTYDLRRYLARQLMASGLGRVVPPSSELQSNSKISDE